MKTSVIIFKTLFVLGFLFLLSSRAFGNRLPLQISKGFGSILNDLKINTENFSPEEIKFLEDALDKNPVWMFEDPKSVSALFGTSSYHVDEAYRKLFFPRLNPSSEEQMSAFFESMEAHYKKINSFENGEDSIETWRKITKGSVEAIQRGDFGGISLNDFRTLYANHIIEKINNDTGFLETAKKMRETTEEWGGRDEGFIVSQLKLKASLHALFDFFQGTTVDQSGRLSQRVSGSVDQDVDQALKDLPFGLDHLYDKVINSRNGREAQEVLENSTRRLSEGERDFLESMDKVFASPFLKPSIGFWRFFQITLLRSPDTLNNAGFILRLWNSNLQWYRKIIITEFGIQFNVSLRGTLSSTEFSDLINALNNSRVAAISPNRVTEVYRNLLANDLARAIMEASRESVELSNTIGEFMKELDNSAIHNSDLLH